MRSDPVETARRFVAEHFPDAKVALVGGSVIRGEGTPTSDLDIVILIDREDAPFRASYMYGGWPIEAFVQTDASLPRFLDRDADRHRPSLHRMIAEAIVLRDPGGLAAALQAESRAVLERGPQRLDEQQVEDWRYSVTDLLDDFVGAQASEEGMFVANDLAVEIVNLTLLRHGKWLGSGKWVTRAARVHDGEFASRVTGALRAYYQREDKQPLIDLARRALDDAGGRLFEGYYRAAPKQ